MNFIVAVSEDYAIGRNNDLLFSLPTDLAYFKEKTLNKVVVMGRKTFDSLPRKPLPKRTNIVLSSSLDLEDENIIIVRTLNELVEHIKFYNSEDVFVIGGASIYNLLMDYCERAYITKINVIVPADTYIENVEKKENWKEVSSSELIEENGLSFQFKVFENTKVKDLSELEK